MDKIFLLFPTLVTVIGGYLIWLRKNRKVRFMNDLSESIKDAILPIYHDMRHIRKTVDSQEKEKLFLKFFTKYSGSNSMRTKGTVLLVGVNEGTGVLST